LPDYSPDDSRRLSQMTNTCISTTSAGQCPDGFARRKRCVTTSELPDCVAFDVDVEEEENEEGKKPQDDVEDVLWMGNKGTDGWLFVSEWSGPCFCLFI